jgi:uncharacterized protein HemX
VILKLAAAALPVALAWGALGWYLWRQEMRRLNRVEAVRDMRKGIPLSERADVRAAMEFQP